MSAQNNTPDEKLAPAPYVPGRPFPKGVSGNPGGRPKQVLEVVAAAREHTTEAIKTLATIMKKGESEQARCLAADKLLNRGWGLPSQRLLHAGDPESPVVVDIAGLPSEVIERIADLGRQIEALIAQGKTPGPQS